MENAKQAPRPDSEIAAELEEIRQEMIDSLDRAQQLAREKGGVFWQRAKGYWIAQLRIALENDHGYMGGAGCSMQDAIEELDGDGCPNCGASSSLTALNQCRECGEEVR